MRHNKKERLIVAIVFLPSLILGQKQNIVTWKLSREIKLDHLITDVSFDTYRKDGKEVIFPKIVVYKDEVKCYDEDFKEKNRILLPKFSNCMLSPNGNYFGVGVPTKMTSERDPKGFREFTVYNDTGGKVSRIKVEEWWDEGIWVFVISPADGSFVAPISTTNKIIFYDSWGNIKKEINLFGKEDFQYERGMDCAYSDNGEFFVVVAAKKFTPDFSEMPTSSPNLYVILFDNQGNELWRNPLEENIYNAFAISSSGRFICTGSERRDKDISRPHFYLFNNSGKLIGKYSIEPSHPFVPFCKFSKDEEFLIIGNYDKVQLIKTSSGKVLWTKQFQWNIGRDILKEEGIRYIKGVDIADGASAIAIVSFDYSYKHPYWSHSSQQLDILDNKGNLLLTRQANETQKADLSLEERDLVWVNPSGTQIFLRLKKGFEIYERVSSEIQAELYDITAIAKGVNAEWSPDGKKIAYAYHGINVIGSEGKKESKKLTSEHVWQFAWSPDSREIAYIASNHLSERRGKRSWQFWVKIVDIETGKIRTIYEPYDLAFGKIWWLDDGNIGFFEESEDPSEHKWVVLDRFGKVPEKITSSEKIVYVYNVNSDILWIMNADNTEKRRLQWSEKPRIRFMSPIWSKAARKILVNAISDSSYLMITDENGTTWQPLLYLGGTPQWSPDGKWIICDIYVGGQDKLAESELYLVSIDGKQKFQLTSTSKETEVSPKWSPDGSKILFEETTSGNIFVAKIKIDHR